MYNATLVISGTLVVMTKLLNGAELADYIKERQAKQVRNLRQAHNIVPKLAIIVTDPSPVIASYMRLKRRYGEDILIDVEVFVTDMESIISVIEECNVDAAIHGIIVQLPLSDPGQTDGIVALIAPEKDVDGLGPNAKFDSATATAINWLLTGYGVDLVGKKIVIVGNGRLVGAPLATMWRTSGYDISVVDETVKDLSSVVSLADIIVTATGVPRLITDDMLKQGAVVVDAGTASENGVIVGDLDPDVRQTRDDLTLTPEKGGVGPLTVATLFDAVIQAARYKIS